MELSNQTQKAGDNAQQIQLGNNNTNTTINYHYHLGVSEELAKQFLSEQSLSNMEQKIDSSIEEVKYRIDKFETRWTPILLSYENNASFLEEPYFQKALYDARMAASITEREEDYDNILKLSFFTKNREVVAEYMKTLPDDIFAYFDDMNPELHSGEFYMKDTNKATGMNKVLEYFNHPIERTIA